MTRKISGIMRGLGLGIVAWLIGGIYAQSSVAHAEADADRSRKEQPQQALSPKVGKALVAAQELMQKQDWNGAFAKVQEAQAVADRRPYDDYQIAEMLGYIEIKRQNYPEASAAFEQSIASGMLPPAETLDRLKLLTQLAMQLKDYPKAILFAGKAIASSAEPEPQLHALAGQAQYLSGDYKGATASMAQAVERARKLGKPVEETWLQVQLSGYVQLKDAPGVLAALKQLAVAYPKKSYLMDLFGQWKRDPGDNRMLLNLYRLMFHLGLLEYSEDYLKLVQLAIEFGLPGEAITVLEKGNADKKFVDEVEQVQYKQQLASAKTLAVTDRKTVQTMEQSTGNKSGEDDAQLGVALASYEQYDKAVQALKSGIAKGGVKRLDQAQIVLGYALLKLNRPAEAQLAFAEVQESAPLGVIAQLWGVYTREPSPLGT